MSRRPDAQYSVLRAILRHGPGITNLLLRQMTGLNKNGVESAIKRAKEHGRITVKGAVPFKPSRRMYVTQAGHDFLADFEMNQYTKGVEKKPSAAYQGEAKTRECRMCLEDFPSEWPGHRICDRCRDTKTWRGGYDPEHYTSMGGR